MGPRPVALPVLPHGSRPRSLPPRNCRSRLLRVAAAVTAPGRVRGLALGEVAELAAFLEDLSAIPGVNYCRDVKLFQGECGC